MICEREGSGRIGGGVGFSCSCRATAAEEEAAAVRPAANTGGACWSRRTARPRSSRSSVHQVAGTLRRPRPWCTENVAGLLRRQVERAVTDRLELRRTEARADGLASAASGPRARRPRDRMPRPPHDDHRRAASVEPTRPPSIARLGGDDTASSRVRGVPTCDLRVPAECQSPSSTPSNRKRKGRRRRVQAGTTPAGFQLSYFVRFWARLPGLRIWFRKEWRFKSSSSH